MPKVIKNSPVATRKLISKESIKQTFAINKTLYDKAVIVAKRRGLKVSDILRQLLSEEISKEIFN